MSTHMSTSTVSRNAKGEKGEEDAGQILTASFDQGTRQTHAEELWAAGFALLPLQPTGKEPHFSILEKVHGSSKWTPLRDGRKASLPEIREWFRLDPTLNIGIITGTPSQLVVFDVDRPDKLEGVHLPPTLTVETSPGRLHFYYRCRREVESDGHPWGELQAEGKYVVAAHSLHEAGHLYRYAELLGPEEFPFDDLTPLPPRSRSGVNAGPTGGFPTSTNTPSSSSPVWVGTNPGHPGSNPVATTPPQTPLENLSTTPPNENDTILVRPPAGDEVKGRAKTPQFRELVALAGVPEVAFKVLGLCGQRVTELGRAFLCPLPGHEEQQPSAALWQKSGELIMMHDFHRRQDPDWWPLADVYAAVITGRTEALGSGERAVWWLRALHEAGCIDPPSQLTQRLPRDAPRAAQRLYQGFCYLLSLRRLYDPHQAEEAPFSWRFAAKWCGYRSTSTVSKGMKWLLSKRYLRVQQEGSKIGDTGQRHPTTFILGTPEEGGKQP